MRSAYLHAVRARALFASGVYVRSIQLAAICLAQAPNLFVCQLEKIASQVAPGLRWNEPVKRCLSWRPT